MPAQGAPAPQDERAFLENQLAYLEQQLSAVRERLAELGTEPAEE
jgi:hypothetical protein